MGPRNATPIRSSSHWPATPGRNIIRPMVKIRDTHCIASPSGESGGDASPWSDVLAVCKGSSSRGVGTRTSLGLPAMHPPLAESSSLTQGPAMVLEVEGRV